MDLAELTMMLQSLDSEPVNEQEFKLAMGKAKEIGAYLDDEQQLVLYGLFKQSTVGKIPEGLERPAPADMVAMAKWKAWESFAEFPKEGAAKAYIFVVNQAVADIEEAKKYKEDSKKPGAMDGLGMIVSTLNGQGKDENLEWTDSEQDSAFKAVVEGNQEALEAALTKEGCVSARDEEGMTLLHFAADRGQSSLVSVLLAHGASVNAADNSGLTPLMLAVSCEHLEVAALLIKTGADVHQVNSDGQSVLHFDDVSAPMKAVLAVAM